MAFRPPGKPQAEVVAGAQGEAEAGLAEGRTECRKEGGTEGRTEPVKSGPADTEPNDRGAGTVAALAICLVLLGFSAVALVMVQASVAAVRAAAAADLAALAGADALRGLGPSGASPGADFDAGNQGPSRFDAGNQGPSRFDAGNQGPSGLDTGAGAASGAGDACGVAGEVAARNNAGLRDCTADPGSGTVTVETAVQVPALPVPAVARARAGPPG